MEDHEEEDHKQEDHGAQAPEARAANPAPSGASGTAGAGEPLPAPEATDAPLLSWLPLGLWTGLLLAGLRLCICFATEQDLSGALWHGDGTAAGDPSAQALGVTLAALPLTLEHSAVVGLISAALLARRGASLGPLLFVAGFFLTSLSGWPLEPEVLRPGLDGTGLASVWIRGAAALALALVLCRAIAHRWFGGPGSLVAALLLAGAALIGHGRLAGPAPQLVYGETVRELLHLETARTVLAERPDAPVAPRVITPNVWNHTDSADKPALALSPPARVRLVIPGEIAGEIADAPGDDPGGDPDKGHHTGHLRLITAAGVDKTVRNRMPAGVNRETIRFTITINGEQRFRSEITSTRDQAPEECVWHHALEDGVRGLAVNPGDEVILETVRAGTDGRGRGEESGEASGEAGGSSGGAGHGPLLAGFSDLILERETRRPLLSAAAARPNVVLVVMDTLRADRLSCYGYDKPTSPHLDKLAARGTLYRNAVTTASWTWPSTASLLTGLPADSHGVVSNESCTLTRGLETLAEVLRDSGYATGAFSGNPLVAPERLFDQGFADFDAHRSEFRKSTELLPGALDWIRSHRLDRFFLYLHLVDPHTPLAPLASELARLGNGTAAEKPVDFPERGLDVYAGRILRAGPGADPDAIVPAAHRAWMENAYDASVASGDAALGEVMALLAELGLTDNTVIAFTSDHGEELMDHGMLAHGHTLYGELVRAPLVLAGPGIPRGQRVSGTVSNRHLAPTLAHLASAELAALSEGVLLLGEGHATPGSAITQTMRGTWNGAKRQALYGLVKDELSFQWRPETAEGRLFDTVGDGGEQHDTAAAQPDRAAALAAELKERLREQRRWTPAHTVGAGASTLEMMRGVGYLGEDE